MVRRSSRMSRSFRVALLDVREWTEALLDVRGWTEALPDVWE